MDVGTFLVSDAKATKLIQPGKASLHNPSPSTKATPVLRVAHREQRQDTPVAQTLPDCLRIIAAVAYHTIRTMARTPAFSLQWWDGIDECQSLL
jgi:hypothetical protein